MATRKSKPNKIDKSFDFDSDFDIPNFDFDEPKIKDDRKPIVRAAVGVGKGAAGLVKDSNFIKRQMKRMLPKGYGDSWEVADNVKDSLKNLYDESAKELKPAMRESKRMATKLIPRESKLVPDSVKKLLKRWDDDAKSEQRSGSSAWQMREDSINTQLADVFREQMKFNVQTNAQQEGRDRLKEGMETLRHRESAGLMARAAISLDKIQKYQSTVTLGFQKKSLELQMRTLLATQDMLGALKESDQKRDALLLAISKNTMLPDTVKATSKEAKEAMARNQWNAAVNRGLFGKRDQIVEQMLSGLSSRVLEQVRGAATGVMGLSTMADMASMGGPSDPWATGGEFAGAQIGDIAGHYLGKKFKAGLNSGKLDRFGGKKILAGGLKAQYGLENMGQKLNAFKRNDDYLYQFGAKGKLMQFLQELVPSQTPKTSLTQRNVRDLDTPSMGTKRVNLSITDVIPGYLARMYRELQIMRTGNTKIELTQYEWGSGRFTSKSKIEAALGKEIINPDRAARVQGMVGNLLNQIDPKGELSPEARKELGKHLMMTSANTREANEEQLGQYSKYSVKNGKQLAPHMRKYLGSLSMEDRIAFTRSVNDLYRGLGDPSESIQRHADWGNLGALKKMGLVSADGKNINVQGLVSQMLDPGNAQRSQAPRRGSAGGYAFAGMAHTLAPGASVRDQASSVIDKAKAAAANYKNTLQDIYVRGEKSPRLIAYKFKIGAYRDRLTKKVLESAADIRGAVEDITEGGAVVLQEADIDNLVTQGQDGLTRIQAKAKEVASDFMQSDAMASVREAAQALQDKTGEVIERIQDVYVEGEKDPRIIAAKLIQGQYFKEETGETLTDVNDIDGPIRDRTDDSVVIQASEVPRLRRWDKKKRKFGLLTRAAIGVGKFLWGVQKFGYRASKFNLSVLWSATKGAFGLARKMLGFAPKVPKDIYVGREPQPRLYAARFKAGDYRDLKTGERITHHDDIRGPVIDRDDQIVLAEEDLPLLRVYDSVFKVFNPLRLVGWVVKKTGQLAKGIVKFTGRKLLQAQMAIFRGIGSAAKGIASRFAKPVDVYVTGELKARLKGSLMGTGAYFSQKTGKEIRSAMDIDGPVVSPDGQTTYLDENEIKRGLVDVGGRPLASGIGSMIGRGLSAVNKLFSVRVKLKNDFTGKSTDKVMKSKAATTGDKTVALLSDIKNIFQRQFGGGDELRAGSWRERLRARKNAGPVGTAGKAVPAAKSGGLLSGLGDLLGLGRGAAGIGAMLPMLAAAGVMAAGSFGMNKLMGFFGLGGKGVDKQQDDANWSRMSFGEKVESGLARTTENVGRVFLQGNLADEAANGRISRETSYLQGKAAGVGVSDKSGQFDRIRFAQYGFVSNPGMSQKAMAMEDLVMKVTRSGRINDRRLNWGEIYKLWGFDPRNQDQCAILQQWYAARFKPVFEAHLSAIDSFAGSADLSAIGKIPADKRYDFLQALRSATPADSETAMPDPSGRMQAPRRDDIERVIQDAMKQMGLKAPGEKDAAPAAAASADPTKPVSAAATAAVAASNIVTPGGDSGPSIFSKLKSAFFGGGNDTSALLSVRMRAYGLTDLDAGKVSALRAMESGLMSQLRISGDEVSFAGKNMEILNKYQGSFGVSAQLEGSQARWVNWFKNRFLPVFMTWALAVQRATGRAMDGSGEPQLKVSDQYKVAQAILGMGVWDQTDSPWPGFKLNTDASSTRENMAFLEKSAKDAKLEDPRSPVKSQADTRNEGLFSDTKRAIKSFFGMKDPVADASADVEAQVKGSGGAAASVQAGSSGLPPSADGDLFDGRNAMSYIKLKGGVNLEGMHPQFMKNFTGMVEEYNKLTGKSITVNDAFRSREMQMAMRQKYGNRAAAPGNSLHEFGLAMDIDSATLNELDKMGLMRKYGFTRPVGGEAWHMEPAGIQGNISGFKQDPDSAGKAIESGLGRGGGGYGTVDGASKYQRNQTLAMQLYTATGGANAPAVSTKDKLLSPNLASTTAGPGSATPGGMPRGANRVGGGSSDIEAFKLTPAGSGMGTSGGGGLQADPSVKVPDPQGEGYAGLKNTILAAAKMVGVDGQTLLKMAAMESGFKSGARAGVGSATGLFQFTKATWDEMITKYGAKYGFGPMTSPTDPKAAAIMAAHMLKDSQGSLGKNYGGPIGETESYLTHFLGPSGASSFLQSMQANPQGYPAQDMPKAAAANRSIFYDGRRPRTYQEVYSLLQSRISTKSQQFGIGGDTSPQTGMVDAPAPSVTSAPSPIPTAKPKAVSTSGADMYAFQPAPLPAASRQAPMPQPSQMDPSIMKATNDVLLQQLDVQRQMLEYLRVIASQNHEAAQVAGQTEAAVQDKQPSSQDRKIDLDLNSLAVSMRRAMSARR